MPPRYDAVLFDLDDTLWHFDDALPVDQFAAALAPLLERLITSWGQRSSTSYADLDLALLTAQFAAEQHAHEANGHREPDHVALFRTTLATYEVEATTAQARQLFFALRPDVAMTRPRLFDGALETIEALSAAGTRLAVVTNRSRDAAALDDELHHHGLTGLFSAVVTAGDVGWLKPHPAIVHAALEALDVPPGRALMVGDTPNRDIAAANSAGVTSVLIAHPGRAAPAPTAPEEQPHHTIATLAELLDLFGS